MPVALPLSNDDLTRILTVGKPVFLSAQGNTGVPWQAIAGIWYRESFSLTPPTTPGGPFQFDSIPSSESLALLLKRFTETRQKASSFRTEMKGATAIAVHFVEKSRMRKYCAETSYI